jgi:hypothetical protein
MSIAVGWRKTDPKNDFERGLPVVTLQLRKEDSRTAIICFVSYQASSRSAAGLVILESCKFVKMVFSTCFIMKRRIELLFNDTIRTRDLFVTF